MIRDVNVPCKDCKKRWVNEHTTCHSTCAAYKKWKIEFHRINEEIREKIKLDRDSYSEMDSIQIKKYYKYANRSRRPY